MNIRPVLFKEAIMHFSRMFRILTGSAGHLLSIGLSGSGRKTLLKLVAAAIEADVEEPTASRSYGLTELLKLIVKRPRPYIQNIRIVPVYRAMGTSFPSGHTSTTIATATALSMAYPKWYVIAPAFLWAGSVGYSRMYLGVHYPTDVTGGALLGAGTAASLSFMRGHQ